MKASRFTIIAILLLILSIAGCNLPSSQTATPNAYTAAAMTVTALAGTEQAGPQTPTPTLFATLPPATTPAITSTTAPPPASQASATPNGILFVTDVGANCRSGPGTNYDKVGSFVQGSYLPLVGRNTDSTWWVVLTGGNANCWISASTGHTSGQTGTIPVVAAPPTPTLGPTATPTGATAYP